MRGNMIAVFETIQYLQSQSFVQNEISDYKWISRQLIQQTLKTRYNLKLELDTIQRHFRRLSISGVVDYLKVGAKDCFQVLSQPFCGMIYQKNEIDTSFLKNQTKIESIFKFYSKNQNLNIQDEFENFILHYENRKNAGKFDGWYSYNFFLKKWQKWCKNIKELINPLDSYFYDEKFKAIGGKREFEHFQTHYQGLGTIVKNPLKMFESWVKTSKKFKTFTTFQNTNQSQKSKEKQDYKWNFRKAKEVSDRIKDWLEFEKGINWLDDYYWKGKSIPGIGWQKVMHPDFNKEEILLFKIENKIMIDNIEDVEILS